MNTGGTAAILRRYALIMWRRRWVALGTAWLICLVGWVGVMCLPSIYEADAEVAVASQSALAPFLQGMTVGDNASHDAALLLQYTLLSRPSLGTLIAKGNLLDGRDTPEARAALENQLAATIRIVPVTDVFGTQQVERLFITYRNHDPERAYAVVKGVLGMFVDQTIGSSQNDLANAARFLDDQIVSYKGQLHSLEQRRAAFVAKYFELLPGDNGTPSQYNRVRSDVETLTMHLRDIQSEIALLQRELAKTPELLTAGPGAPANAQALATAEQHLATLRLQYTDAYPAVIQARNLVAALASGKGTDAARGQAVPNPVFDQIKVHLIDAHTTEITVQGQLEAATAERDRMAALAKPNPNLLAEYGSLDHSYQLVQKQYNELLSRRASMQITTAATQNAHPLRLNVVNPPQLPIIPVAPRRKLLLLGVLLAGLGGGAMVAFALAYTDSCCYTVRELEDIGLPVIGGISLRHAAALQRHNLLLFAFGGGLFLLLVACASIIKIGGHLGWGA
ncbi:MAG: XrtA system polysaccharide chain length determinant [Acetobacteraceae bacterium]